MYADHYKDFTNLHRMIYMGSGTTKFIGASNYHLLSTLNFLGFISLGIRGYKINKITKLLSKIISTVDARLSELFYLNFSLLAHA